MGLKNQAFGKGRIAKINFRRNWISHDSRVNLLGCWVAFGPIFMIFVALEIDLKVNEFSGDSGVIPDPETEPGGCKLHNSNSNLSSAHYLVGRVPCLTDLVIAIRTD